MMLAELLDVVTLTTRPPAVNSHTSAPLGVFVGDTAKSRVTGGAVFVCRIVFLFSDMISEYSSSFWLFLVTWLTKEEAPFGHFVYPRRQLLANAAMAASRVAP